MRSRDGAVHAGGASRRAGGRFGNDGGLHARAVAPIYRGGVRVERAEIDERRRRQADGLPFGRVLIRTGGDVGGLVVDGDEHRVAAAPQIVIANGDGDVVSAVVGIDVADVK